MYQSNNITISQQVLDIKSDGSINQRSHSKYSMKEAGLTHHRTQRNMWKGELDKFGNRDRCILLISEKNDCMPTKFCRAAHIVATLFGAMSDRASVANCEIAGIEFDWGRQAVQFEVCLKFIRKRPLLTTRVH